MPINFMGSNISSDFKTAVESIIEEHSLDISSVMTSSPVNGVYTVYLIHSATMTAEKLSFKLVGSVATDIEWNPQPTFDGTDKTLSNIPDISQFQVYVGTSLALKNDEILSTACVNAVASILDSFTTYAPDVKILAVFDKPANYDLPANKNITHYNSSDCVADLYHRLLLSDNLLAHIHLGHGFENSAESGLALYGSEELSSAWINYPQLLQTNGSYGPVQELDLSKKILTWNSCKVADLKMINSLDDCNVRTFIGGITDLGVDWKSTADSRIINPLTGLYDTKGSCEVISNFWKDVLKKSSSKMVEEFIYSNQGEILSQYNQIWKEYGYSVVLMKKDATGNVLNNGQLYSGESLPMGHFGYYGDEGPLVNYIDGWEQLLTTEGAIN